MSLRTFTAEQLAEIQRLHGMWRRGEEGGKRADLARANLADADLAGAYLARAYLARADLAGAYLAGAYLAGADLADADLAGANLAGAYLAGAKGLTPAPADPAAPYVRPTTPEAVKAARRERMLKYRARNPDVPVVEGLDAKILESVTTGAGRLEMSTWHSCGTTHCRGGWAIVHAGEAGAKLEAQYDSQQAATMIYRASTGRVPHFFATNERALEDIRACAKEQVVNP